MPSVNKVGNAGPFSPDQVAISDTGSHIFCAFLRLLCAFLWLLLAGEGHDLFVGVANISLVCNRREATVKFLGTFVVT